MSCRETSAGSAFTTWARRASGRVLSDPAVLSAFHELNRQHSSQGENARVYSEEGYRLLLSRTLADVDRFSDRGNNVRSLQRRLRAAFDEPMPSQDVVHALYNINTLVYERTQYLETYLGRMSLSLGLSMEATRARFHELEAATPRSRSNRPDTYTDVNRTLAADMGLGQDVGIVNAVARLEEEANAIEIARWRAAPQLITQTSVYPQRVQGGGADLSIIAYGYDETSRRLEVTVMDNGVERTFAYRNVPPSWSPDSYSDYSTTWYRRIHGNPECQYPSEYEEARAGVATRCDTCGQYATSGHSCPPRRVVSPMNRYSTSSRWSRQAVPMPIARWDILTQSYVEEETNTGVMLPAIREFRTAVAAGPVSLNLDNPSFMYLSHWTEPNLPERQRASMTSCFLMGDVLVERQPDTNELTVDMSSVRCSCATFRQNGSCPHVDGYATAIRERLDPPAVDPSTRAPRAPRARMTNEERQLALVEAQARSEAVAAETDWMLDEAGKAEASATWRSSTDVLYSEDYASYMEDVEAAKMRSAAKGGGPAIPYMTENALDGYCQRGSGQAFGMEIEFDIKPGVDKRTALTTIARELHAAGLIPEPVQVQYGASRRRGFVDSHTDSRGGTWSFEQDGSVDAELVTPGMYDEEETWQKLELATEIIRRNGGIPSKRAGAHVHVGSSNFNGDVAAYTEMARIMNQHEDVVYRLAANPERGTHRNNRYSTPLPPVPAEGFIDVYRLKSKFHRRMSAINFTHVQGRDTDHPEYRLWDSSLDPGTMQAQVKMSVFMKEAALRHVQSGTLTTRDKEPSGSHIARFKARGTRVALTPEEAEADSRTIRSFLDTICRRREDKAQLASLVPFTKWGKQRGG